MTPCEQDNLDDETKKVNKIKMSQYWKGQGIDSLDFYRILLWRILYTVTSFTYLTLICKRFICYNYSVYF